MMRYKCFLTNDPAKIEQTLADLHEQTGMAPMWPPVITPAVNLSGGYVYVAIGYMDNAPAPAPKKPEPPPAELAPMPAEEMVEKAPAEERQEPRDKRKPWERNKA